jgi:ribosomal protein L37AE/L43A
MMPLSNSSGSIMPTMVPKTDASHQSSDGEPTAGVGRKVGRFMFVSVPRKMLGVDEINNNNAYLRRLFKAVVSVQCPHCGNGLLDQVDSTAWQCGACDQIVEADSGDRKGLIAACKKVRAEKIYKDFALLDAEKIDAVANNHKIASRLYFGVSSVVVVGFFYMLYASSVLMAMNWLSFAVMFWVMGMKKSYYYWLVRSGALFKSKFWAWFRDEKWLV